MDVPHIEKRRSRELEDRYPPEYFVPWHDLLVVWDLRPGQWSLSPEGQIMQRLDERHISETTKSVIC